MENTIIARNYKFENKELTKATTAIAKATESAAKSLLKIASVMAEVEAVTAEVVEEEPDEIAMNFLYAKTALDRLVELFADDRNTAEILTEMKTRLEIIENGGTR